MNFIIDSPTVGSKSSPKRIPGLKLHLKEETKFFADDTQMSQTPWIFGSAMKYNFSSEIVLHTPVKSVNQKSSQKLSIQLRQSPKKLFRFEVNSSQSLLKASRLQIPSIGTSQAMMAVRGSDSNLNLGIQRIRKDADPTGQKEDQGSKQVSSSSGMLTEQSLPLGPGFINHHSIIQRTRLRSEQPSSPGVVNGEPSKAGTSQRSTSQRLFIEKPSMWRPPQQAGDCADVNEDDIRTISKKPSYRVDQKVPPVVIQGWELYAPYMTPSSNLSSNYVQQNVGFGRLAELRSSQVLNPAPAKPALSRTQSNWETNLLQPKLIKLSRNMIVEQANELLKNKLGGTDLGPNREEALNKEVFG